MSFSVAVIACVSEIIKRLSPYNNGGGVRSIIVLRMFKTQRSFSERWKPMNMVSPHHKHGIPVNGNLASKILLSEEAKSKTAAMYHETCSTR